MKISHRELATILPALEYWKEELTEGTEWIPESLYFQKHSPLTFDEIDELYDRFEQLGKSDENPNIEVQEECRLEVPTYFGAAFPDAVHAGVKEEFDSPHVPVLIYREAGIRILLGTDNLNDEAIPDIKIERRPRGWAIFLHPNGATDPSGYIYFLDDGRSFIVRDDFMLSGAIQVLRFDDPVPDLDQL